MLNAAQACLALADLVEVTFARDQRPTPGRTQAARTAVCALRRRFLLRLTGRQARPHGGPRSARVVDGLDWLPPLLAAPAQVPGAYACPEEAAAAVGEPVAAPAGGRGQAGRPAEPPALA